MKKRSLLLMVLMLFTPCFGAMQPMDTTETCAQSHTKTVKPNSKESTPKISAPNLTFKRSKSLDTILASRTMDDVEIDENKENSAQSQTHIAAPTPLSPQTAPLKILTTHSTSAASSSLTAAPSIAATTTPSPDICTSPTLSMSLSPSITSLSALSSPSPMAPPPVLIQAPPIQIEPKKPRAISKLELLQQLIVGLPEILGDASSPDEDIIKQYEALKDTGAKKLIYKEFEQTVALFFETMNKTMDDDKLWVGKKPQSIFCKTLDDTRDSTFNPFVQKITLENQDARHIGDLHGGIHTLVDTLTGMCQEKQLDENLQLAKDMNIIIHGDMVGRGFFGIETLWVIMTLKILNPNSVFILRGNHEDWGMNGKSASTAVGGDDGFWRELYKISPRIYSLAEEGSLENLFKPLFEAIYNLLPVALIINNEILCCHAAPDWCYNPTALREAKQPIAFECLTKENYNPAWITAQLSDQCLRNLATDIAEIETKCPTKTPTEMAEYLGKIAHRIIASYTEITNKIQIMADDSSLVKDAAKRNEQVQQTDEKNGASPADLKAVKEFFEKEFKKYTLAREGLKKSIAAGTEVAQRIDESVKNATQVAINPTTLLDICNDINALCANLQKDATATFKATENFSRRKRMANPIRDELETFPMFVEQVLGRAQPYLTAINLSQALYEIMRTPSARADIYRHYGIFSDSLPAIFGKNGAFTTLFLNHIDNQITSVDDLDFVWRDLIVDEKRSFLCSQTTKVTERFGQSRPAFGKDLINEIMRLQGFSCVIRGHQQMEAMRSLLDDNYGIVHLWDCQESFRNTDIHCLKKGAVYTLDLAASCYESNERPFESSALVCYAATFDECSIVNELIDMSSAKPPMETIDEKQEYAPNEDQADGTARQEGATTDSEGTIIAASTTPSTKAVEANVKVENNGKS